MSMFAVMGALVVLAALVVLLPASRRSKPRLSQGDCDRTLYREQLRALDAEEEDSADRKKAEKTEIERRILNVAPQDSEWIESGGRFFLFLFLAGLAPVSLGLYSLLGSPHLPSRPFAERNQAEERKTEDMRRMIEGLAIRLERDSSDVDGWILLSRSLLSINESVRAEDAARKALFLRPGDGYAMRALAFARMEQFLSGGAPIDPEALALLEKATMDDPGDEAAAYLLGQAYAKTGDAEKARVLWMGLRDRFPPGSDGYGNWSDAIGRLTRSR
ncbi:hypothetical protein FACS1894205_5070 [Alphaproteobacteria bacterium]|nr:hypothetical protein FACS1894205_5070 [Alphaproteobacteria bacterium]